MGQVVQFPVDEIEMDFATTIVDLAKKAPLARQVAVLKGMGIINKMMHHAMDTKDQALMSLLCELGYAIYSEEEGE